MKEGVSLLKSVGVIRSRFLQIVKGVILLLTLILINASSIAGKVRGIDEVRDMVAEKNQKLLLIVSGQRILNANVKNSWLQKELIDPLVNDTQTQKIVVSRPYCPAAIKRLNTSEESDPCEEDVKIDLVLEIYAPADVLTEISSNLILSFPDIPFAAYRVRERRPRIYQRDWPLGERSPGARLVALMVKRDALTKTEFETYWHDTHTAIALAQPIGVWNYLQNTVISCQGACENIHGIALEQFRNATDLSNRFKKTPWPAIKGIWSASKFMNLFEGRSQLMTERVLKDNE